jgi:hypothetical protein
MVEDERNEGVDVDALDKTLEKLTKVVENLTKELSNFAKAASQGTKSSGVDHEKLHKNRMKEQESYFANVKAMKLLSAEMKNGTNSFKMFTGLLSKGITVGYAFDKLAKHTIGFIDTNDKLRDSQKQLLEMIKKYGEIGSDKGGTEGKWSDASDKDRSRAQKLQEATKGKEGSKIADQLTGAKEFFGKHKMGIMLGAGAAGVLLKVLKMAFDASPMFQQMLKLWKYGIMMILRPIGDFFGFVMRPIMILLLRKFIIPWYTKMYPQMMKWGTEIGTKLAGALGALADGDIGGAFAALWGDVDWGKLIWDAVRLAMPIVAAADFVAGIFGVGDNTYTNEWGRKLGLWFQEGLDNYAADFSAFWTKTSKWFSDGIAEISGSWNYFWNKIVLWFSAGIGSITNSWSSMWLTVWSWIYKGLNGITTSWKSMWNSVYNWIAGGLDGITKSWNSIWSLVYNWIADGIASLNPFSGLGGNGDGGWNPLNWASGGHITEPIMGIGKSGKQYMMGESGNETVIPDNKIGSMGGSNITINIQNMSGSEQDLSNLRQTILNVMQESNTRRGRV